MANDEESDAKGWDAIDRAVKPLYDSQKPLHYGTALPFMLGGKDPLQGISVYRRDDPIPHWHYITYGFTELFAKDSSDPEISGYGFELTFRLQRGDEDQPPVWAVSFLQNLGRYVFSTGNIFCSGHYLNCNGPIALDENTELCAALFVKDPELPEIDGEYGKAEFLQVIGITPDEELAVKRWNSDGVIDLLREQTPLLCTDLNRTSIVCDHEIAARIDQASKEEGSSTSVLFFPGIAFEPIGGTATEPTKALVRFGANQAGDFALVLPARLLHNRSLTLASSGETIEFVLADPCSFSHQDSLDRVSLTREAVMELSKLVSPKAMDITPRAFPNLTIAIHKSEIRDHEGNVVKVIG